jgi:ribose-phosphate pyrophosphokinase
MSLSDLALLTLAGSEEYARRVARRLGFPLSPVEERSFEDGERKVRPLVSVEGKDAYVIHALHGDVGRSVNDKLCRLLFLIGALKDHDAQRVTAVLPYLCYARKDRRTKPYDPVTSRYAAALFEAVGTDRVVAIEVHHPAAYDNAFRCPALHIDTASLFARYFASLAKDDTIVVCSPDAGGVKRVELFRLELGRLSGKPVDNAFVEKYCSGGIVTGGTLVGGVESRTVVILDDLISTGGTLLRAAKACRAGSVRRTFAAAAHGLFVDGATELFASPDLEGLVLADTVRLPNAFAAERRARLTILDSTPLIADAIAAAAKR